MISPVLFQQLLHSLHVNYFLDLTSQSLREVDFFHVLSHLGFIYTQLFFVDYILTVLPCSLFAPTWLGFSMRVFGNNSKFILRIGH